MKINFKQEKLHALIYGFVILAFISFQFAKPYFIDIKYAFFVLETIATGSDLDKISMKRMPCFGACPEYEIEVSRDGAVEYHGERFVKTIGAADTNLSYSQIIRLQAALKTAGKIPSKETLKGYRENCSLDAPGVSTTIDVDGAETTVAHLAGCAPAEWQWFEEMVDEIVNTSQWIGSSQELQEIERKYLAGFR